MHIHKRMPLVVVATLNFILELGYMAGSSVPIRHDTAMLFDIFERIRIASKQIHCVLRNFTTKSTALV